MVEEEAAEGLFLLWTKQIEGRLSILRNLLIKDWQVLDIEDTNELAKYHNLVESKVSCLAILNPIGYQFTRSEIKQIWRIYSLGCSLLVAASGEEGDGSLASSNLNEIIRPFGVKFNSDFVLRPNLYKNYHPKDAMLEDFIANRGVGEMMEKMMESKAASKTGGISEFYGIKLGPKIIYSKGCTLTCLSKTSIVSMTSSQWAIPTRQAICSFYRSDNSRSRMVAFGSANLFTDEYIEKEDNRFLVETLIAFIRVANFPINLSDSKTMEIPEYIVTPNIDRLLDQPICCFQEPEPLPDDKRELMDVSLFNIDNRMSAQLGEAFRRLGVSREPLTLVKPELAEIAFKHLSLEPATHGFLLRKIKHQP